MRTLGSSLARLGAAGALLAATMAATLGPPLPLALAQTAAQTWDVQAGASDPSGPQEPEPGALLYSSNAYFPNPLVIRSGDSVRWSGLDFHTVTFNSGKPEIPFVAPGPNEGEFQLGPGAFPIGVTGNSATYDGTQQISYTTPPGGPPPTASGAAPPPATFTMKFTKPGTYGYVCLLHPGMRGEISVRETSEPLPESPAQATARGQVTAAGLLGRLKSESQRVKQSTGGGGTVHSIQVGAGDAFGGELLQFLNRDITVSRGDSVVWFQADPYEPHTVTFLSGGEPPNLVEPRFQPNGPPQLVFPAYVFNPSGGDTYTGEGIVNSGFMTMGQYTGVPTYDSFALRIDAPPGAYRYECLLHPWMIGTITVAG